MNLVYKWMIGMKRIYDVVKCDQGNTCNTNRMKFKLQHKWDWMNGKMNQGHTITHKHSQIPTKQ